MDNIIITEILSVDIKVKTNTNEEKTICFKDIIDQEKVMVTINSESACDIKDSPCYNSKRHITITFDCRNYNILVQDSEDITSYSRH